MKLYAYCLSDEVTTRTVESLSGLTDARLLLISCEGIVAVASEFDDERVAVTRENVMTHERVVRHVLMETTPLPFRFGTVVSEAELQSYLNSHHAALKSQLEHVRGCVEMSVKVIWNVETFDQEAAQDVEAQDERDKGRRSSVKGSGTSFLLAKRREMLGDERRKESAAEIAQWLAECVGSVVREERVSVQPTESLVVAAAHLVERVRLEDYRRALQRARQERSELHFLTSGVWPPYSFTEINS